MENFQILQQVTECVGMPYVTIKAASPEDAEIIVQELIDEQSDLIGAGFHDMNTHGASEWNVEEIERYLPNLDLSELKEQDMFIFNVRLDA